MKNYYEILEVNPNASAEVIEKAYKVLAKKYHPDLQLDVRKRAQAEKKLKELNEAYDVLSDQLLKDKYDREIEQENKEKMQKMYQNRENQNNEKGQKYTTNNNVGTFAGLVDLVKQLYHDRPKREQFKEMTKKDMFAIFLTIIVVILIGVLLWFIPFTNGWMREFLFENPLFNCIGELFS